MIAGPMVAAAPRPVPNNTTARGACPNCKGERVFYVSLQSGKWICFTCRRRAAADLAALMDMKARQS